MRFRTASCQSTAPVQRPPRRMYFPPGGQAEPVSLPIPEDEPAAQKPVYGSDPFFVCGDGTVEIIGARDPIFYVLFPGDHAQDQSVRVRVMFHLCPFPILLCFPNRSVPDRRKRFCHSCPLYIVAGGFVNRLRGGRPCCAVPPGVMFRLCHYRIEEISRLGIIYETGRGDFAKKRSFPGWQGCGDGKSGEDKRVKKRRARSKGASVRSGRYFCRPSPPIKGGNTQNQRGRGGMKYNSVELIGENVRREAGEIEAVVVHARPLFSG